MRLLIVDDEPLARARLRNQVLDLNIGEIVGEAADGAEAIDCVVALKPDVVLLDIRMPRMDGLETARHLAKLAKPPAVIFTTAYDQHALAAFDASAIDYLLKPIRRDRLATALDKAGAISAVRLARTRDEVAARNYLSAVDKGGLKLVPVDEVRCLQADQGYVSVQWSGPAVLVEESLRNLEQEFGETFMRIHRNTLVAVQYVIALERASDGTMQVILRDHSEPLAVSRRLVPQVRKRLRG